MKKELEEIKAIFLSNDVDSEDYADNLKKVTEWEADIRASEDFLSWQESDITRAIITQAKESFKENAMQLGTNRELNETKRNDLWAKQDAIRWLMSLCEKDAKSTLEQVEKQIRQALSVS